MSSVLARIQAHPSREHLIPRLLEAIAPLNAVVLTHSSSPPNPWANYKRCLAAVSSYTHLCVLQDDALPVRNFGLAIEEIACANPDIPVGLFLSNLPQGTLSYARRAQARGQPYGLVYPNSNVVHTVAVLWPMRKADEFLRWADAHARPSERADDGVLANWVKRTRQAFRVTIPSIVEHDYTVPSVKGGNRNWERDRAGRAWALAEDALAHDWSLSAEVR